MAAKISATSTPLLNTVSGLNGAIPTAWDAGWQFYTDLTKDQIAAFQAMPEWKAFLADHDAWQKSGIGPAPSLMIDVIKTVLVASPNKAK